MKGKAKTTKKTTDERPVTRAEMDALAGKLDAMADNMRRLIERIDAGQA
jgi:hypothetical protein